MNMIINQDDGLNADSLQRYIKAMEMNTQWILQRHAQEEMRIMEQSQPPREEWEDEISIQPSYMSGPDIQHREEQEEVDVSEIYQKVKSEGSPEEQSVKRRMASEAYIRFGETMKAQEAAMEHDSKALNKKG